MDISKYPEAGYPTNSYIKSLTDGNEKVCLGSLLYNLNPKVPLSTKEHYSIESPLPRDQVRTYVEDLQREFKKLPPNEQISIDLQESKVEVKLDLTKHSGFLMLGQFNFLRIIRENPNIVVMYLFLKDQVPELNFYQRLIASHMCRPPNGATAWAVHGGFYWGYLGHIKDLSFDKILEFFEKERPVRIPFIEKRSFQYGGKITNPLVGSLSSLSQYCWVPNPWFSPRYERAALLPLSDLAIKYLLDDSDTKPKWTSYEAQHSSVSNKNK